MIIFSYKTPKGIKQRNVFVALCLWLIIYGLRMVFNWRCAPPFADKEC